MGVRPPHLETGASIDPELIRNQFEVHSELRRSALIFFERGHWCSACRKHLVQICEHWSEFASLPVDVVVITHEAAGDVTFKEYPFLLVADPDLVRAEAFGLVHQDEYGMQTVRPSTILVDSAGTVLFSYVGDDSRDRPTVPALLLALQSILV